MQKNANDELPLQLPALLLGLVSQHEVEVGPVERGRVHAEVGAGRRVLADVAEALGAVDRRPQVAAVRLTIERADSYYIWTCSGCASTKRGKNTTSWYFQCSGT